MDLHCENGYYFTDEALQAPDSSVVLDWRRQRNTEVL
jgi:hypothetical protein